LAALWEDVFLPLRGFWLRDAVALAPAPVGRARGCGTRGLLGEAGSGGLAGRTAVLQRDRPQGGGGLAFRRGRQERTPRARGRAGVAGAGARGTRAAGQVRGGTA